MVIVTQPNLFLLEPTPRDVWTGLARTGKAAPPPEKMVPGWVGAPEEKMARKSLGPQGRRPVSPQPQGVGVVGTQAGNQKWVGGTLGLVK